MVISQAALALHRSSIVLDLHADTLIPMRVVGYTIARRHRPGIPGTVGFFHCDLPRMRQGGVTAQFFGLVTFPYPEGGCASSCMDQITRLRLACEENQRHLFMATTVLGVRRAKEEGRIAALLGVEGGHNLEDEIDHVDRFFVAGVRYLGLAHFTRNRLCAPSGGRGADSQASLTDFGRAVVDRMNRLGMMVDLAHVGRRAFLEAARLSTRPVIVSHTGIHAVFPHWRNIDDEQVRSVADQDGVVGIIFARRYLSLQRSCGLEAFAHHLEYVRRLVGARYLALGSDFDGAVVPVCGLEDVSCLPRITQTLLDRGWTEEEIRGILGENVLRVMGENTG